MLWFALKNQRRRCRALVLRDAALGQVPLVIVDAGLPARSACCVGALALAAELYRLRRRAAAGRRARAAPCRARRRRRRAAADRLGAAPAVPAPSANSTPRRQSRRAR
ncbi:MAG: hypothetical protein MZW92_25390 [Comamonadaceae bacterium]|nr:hypothetical protein [Comamonadaceae bacterium]